MSSYQNNDDLLAELRRLVEDDRQPISEQAYRRLMLAATAQVYGNVRGLNNAMYGTDMATGLIDRVKRIEQAMAAGGAALLAIVVGVITALATGQVKIHIGP